MGACLATSEAAKGMTVGSHGSTFGGNPLAMAVGNAVLDIALKPGFLDHVNRMALLLKQRLAELLDRYPAVIAEIRGRGLLLGLRTHVPNNDFMNAAREQRLLTVSAGDNVVRLLPPLVITDEEADSVLARLAEAIAVAERSHRADVGVAPSHRAQARGDVACAGSPQ